MNKNAEIEELVELLAHMEGAGFFKAKTPKEIFKNMAWKLIKEGYHKDTLRVMKLPSVEEMVNLIEETIYSTIPTHDALLIAKAIHEMFKEKK